MATLQNILNSVIFPMEADELTIVVNGDDRNSNGLYPIKLMVTDPSSGEESILIDSEFVGNEDGEVELDDLGGFIGDYLGSDPKVLSLYVNGDSVSLTGNSSKPCVILPCRVPMEMSAEEYCKEYFLTLEDKVFGTKNTYPQAKEFLSAYIGAEESGLKPTVTLSCSLDIDEKPFDMSIEIKANSLPFEDDLQTGHIVTFDVSPDKLGQSVPPGGTLVSYTVTLGNRHQDYIVRNDSTLVDPLTLAFFNNFGQPDTYHFFGAQEKELKPAYSAVYVKGKKRNYHIDAATTWTVHDHPEYGLGLFEDLAVSKHVHRLPDDTDVVITECDMKDAGINSEPYAVSLSFQESTERSQFRFARKVRTFDVTFDKTFH